MARKKKSETKSRWEEAQELGASPELAALYAECELTLKELKELVKK